MLARAMLTEPFTVPAALNFGPDAQSMRRVSEPVEALAACWGGRPAWRLTASIRTRPRSSRSMPPGRGICLAGGPCFHSTTLRWTADWCSAFWSGKDVGAVTCRQIALYCERLLEQSEIQSGLRALSDGSGAMT